MAVSLEGLGVADIAAGVVAGDFRAIDVAQGCLDRTRARDAELAAFVHLDADLIEKAACAVDAKRRRGEWLGALAGVPVAIKDSICTKDAPTTCASRVLMRSGSGWRSPYDATVVARLRAADAVPFGKTNLDELSMGSSTETSALFVTRNPWDRGRVPGGSSGGSAVAVAAGMVPAALGSDTGGSIRQPAAFTGTTGLKPTYGSVSRYGLVAFASSLDQIGPIAADVRGAVEILSTIRGVDGQDATCAARLGSDLRTACSLDASNIRIGIASEYFGDGVDQPIRLAVKDAVDVLASAGCPACNISLPHTALGVAAYYVLATAEASSNLARFDGVRFGLRTVADSFAGMISRTRSTGFGREVKRRIMLGTYVLSAGYYDAYYVRAQRARAKMVRDFEQAFETVDVIATPTTPSMPWRVGAQSDDPLAMYLSDMCTLPASLAGLPAISIPCGWSEGLPIGLQLIAPMWREDLLVRVAAAWERVAPPHTRRSGP